jgi:hypothetical protein
MAVLITSLSVPQSGMAADGNGKRAEGAALPPTTSSKLYAFGPFAVMSDRKARLIGVTDSRTPAAFLRMLQTYPQIRELEMIDCPGTVDDIANLRLGRLIRARGLATIVPSGGSIRSGTIELFLAGAFRYAAENADIVVHAWHAEDGSGPDLIEMNGATDLAYLQFYQDMGLSSQQARAFYALTSSVPSSASRRLSVADIEQFIHLD